LRRNSHGRAARRYGEGFYAKTFLCVRIFEYGATNIAVTHNGADAGKRDIQTGRFRKLWREEARLHLTGAARFGMKCDGKDRCLRRMRFEVEVQQFDPELLVGCGKCRTDGTDMRCAAFERAYYAPQGHYAADANAFANAGVDDPPLHALANGVDGANGVFDYTSSAQGTFPSSSFHATNYWVDVVYTSSNTYALSGTLSGPGGAGATVSLSGAETLSMTADSSGNYSFDGVVSGNYTVTPSRGGVTFSPVSRNVSIGTGSVSGINFSATVSNPLSISGTITNGSGATVNLSGAATATTTANSGGNYSFGGLLGGSYTVSPQASGEIFSPGSQSVTLSSSNATGVNFTAQTCNCISVWPSSTTPSLVDANDGTPVEVGMKFRSDVVGQVVGARFYKAAGNTGTHVGHLWSSTGTQLAAVTFSNETASGWQQASFSSPVAISSGTTYVISYYAPIGHYSADSGYFTSSGADNAPLHALANGTDGPDGVYLYTAAPGAFPTNTYGSANYWVDVLFAPSATYSISGTISGASGAGATVQLGGSVSVTTTADGSGNYKFLNVPGGNLCSDADQRHWICARHSDDHRIAVQRDRRELHHVAAVSLQFDLGPLCGPCHSGFKGSGFGRVGHAFLC
jgi:Domain of unknown function (DUF4082)